MKSLNQSVAFALNDFEVKVFYFNFFIKYTYCNVSYFHVIIINYFIVFKRRKVIFL